MPHTNPPSLIRSVNPSTGELLAEYPETSPELLSKTFDAARRAQADWSKLSLRERRVFFQRLRDRILESRESLLAQIVRENGKPIVEALATEILPSVDLIRFYESQAPRILKPRHVSMGLMKHRSSRLEYWPLGVVAIISPWNYPFLLPMGEIIPVLLAGNAVIFKPSEVTTGVGLAIQKLFDEAGFPKGLIQTVVGGGALGSALIASKPDKIFFTGSVATGRKVMEAASRHLIPVNLELGGKDAMIVLEDADLELATSAALWGAFSNSGQVCASVERLLVHHSIASDFTARLQKKIATLRQGSPFDPSTDLGAITFERQKLVYEQQVADARKAGAQFLTGGEFAPGKRALRPTLVTGERIESLDIYQQETFGPVVALTTFNSDDEAITKANDSRYGLLASVFTRDLSRARRLARRLEVGTVTINEVLYTAGIAETPWGGIKESGFGRSHGEHGLLEAVHLRHIHEPRFSWLSFKSPWWFPYSREQFELFDALCGIYERSWWSKLRALPRLLGALLRFLGKPRI